MIRAFYSFLLWLAQPLLRRKLAHRADHEAGYRIHVDERFGRYTMEAVPAGAGLVWVHAVSLGETRAAALLITALRERLPGMRLLLTHGTATGRSEGKTLLQRGDIQVWQPWDTKGTVKRFLAHFRPRIGILMETEVWPNLAHACKAAGVPLVLANARLSEKSLQQAQRLRWLSKPAYASLAAVWAQTEADAQRLMQLGTTVTAVVGNLKFDATPDTDKWQAGQAWRAALGGRPVVLLASSRAGEEQALLRILQAKMAENRMDKSRSAPESIVDRVRWLIVPRHPQRFDEVATLIAQHGFGLSRRSQWPQGPASAPQPRRTAAAGASTNDAGLSSVERSMALVHEPAAPDSSLWLGDSMGEMAQYYGLADVALLGGSFEPFGGQNLIEAAACACPVVMGPHTYNFAEAAELAQAAGAAFRATSLDKAVRLAVDLACDAARLQTAREAASGFAAAHRGATEKTAKAIAELLFLSP